MNIIHETQANGALLRLGNQEYVVGELGHWVTLAHYAQIFNVSIKVVDGWIKRGIIPSDSIIELPQFNRMKLIKAVTYSPRKYKKAI